MRVKPFFATAARGCAALLLFASISSEAFAVGGGGGRGSNRANSVSFATTKTTTTTDDGSNDGLAVIGCGVLGTSLCRQLLENPAFGSSRSVTGVTRTEDRHERIASEVGRHHLAERLVLTTIDRVRASGAVFKDVVFCAPPSGFADGDYAAGVREAVEHVWAGPEGGGTFVFTSSGAVYASPPTPTSEGDDVVSAPIVVTESSALAPPSNARAARLIAAEEACLARGGTVLRLAGLYTLERGAHNYWLEKGDGTVRGRADGVLNQLHYDDAAGACVAAVTNDVDAEGAPRIFLVSDGHPATRESVCASALRSPRYADKAMPTFAGTPRDDPGKVYDGTWTNERLRWRPTHASFDAFVSSPE